MLLFYESIMDALYTLDRSFVGRLHLADTIIEVQTLQMEYHLFISSHYTSEVAGSLARQLFRFAQQHPLYLVFSILTDLTYDQSYLLYLPCSWNHLLIIVLHFFITSAFCAG